VRQTIFWQTFLATLQWMFLLVDRGNKRPPSQGHNHRLGQQIKKLPAVLNYQGVKNGS
jgi:hypothetical protein